MAVPQSVKEKAVGLAKQSTYGTGVSDAGSYTQLRTTLTVPDHNLDDFQDDQASGTRHPLSSDHIVDTDLSLPMLQTDGLVRQAESPDLLYAFFQKVTESGTGPYKREFTLPVASPWQPDFTLNQGAFYTLIEKSAGASDSIKIVDGILESIQFNIEGRDKLRYQATWKGRGAPGTAANPSGTWSLSSQSFYKKARLDVCSYNVTGPDYTAPNDVSLLLKGAQLSFAQVIEGSGYDGSGDYQQVVLSERTMEFELVFERTTAAAQAMKDARKNGTLIRFKVGWAQGATPGDTAGDLHFDFYGRLNADVEDDNENILGLKVSGDMRGKDASTVPITVIEAGATAKSW